MKHATLPSPSAEVLAVLAQLQRAMRAGTPCFFLLDFELQEGYCYLDPIRQPTGEIFFDFPAGRTPDPEGKKVAIELSLQPEGLERYSQRFSIIQQGLQQGDSFLANLTLKTPISTTAGLEDIYLSSHATYRILLPGRFVSFSPECFITLRGEELSTHPMKGTIDATLPHATDLLRSDYKEGCEHHTIVDLMRNDLNQVALGVRVKRFKYLSALHTSRGELLQMSSEITGQVDRSAETFDIAQLLLPLLPAGSISGAPKARTLELIREAEGEKRGFYTGIAGYFDGKDLDTAVLIRYVEQTPSGSYSYRSGGGITIHSQCEAEYHECLQKIYIPHA